MSTAGPVAERMSKDIGQAMRDARRSAGLTIAEVARRMGTHRPIVGRLEAGRHLQSLEMIWAYAAAVGCHPIWDILYVMDDIDVECASALSSG